MDQLYYVGPPDGGDQVAVYVPKLGRYEIFPADHVPLARLAQLGIAPQELTATGLYSETDPAPPAADAPAETGEQAATQQDAATGEPAATETGEQAATQQDAATDNGQQDAATGEPAATETGEQAATQQDAATDNGQQDAATGEPTPTDQQPTQPTETGEQAAADQQPAAAAEGAAPLEPEVQP